ncbi:hypothetical protein MAPG_04689, partial [Magnaporthiopsis poae ATCC 64411]
MTVDRSWLAVLAPDKMPVDLKGYPIRIPGAASIVLQGIGLATAAYVGYKLYDVSALWLLPKVPLTRDYYHDGGNSGKSKEKGKGKAKAEDSGNGNGNGEGKSGDGPKAWALVTGASAGIGLGIASELALLGFGVVLLGHRADELSEAADAIRAEVGFSPSSSSGRDSDSDSDDDDDRNPVRTVVMDASTATYKDMEQALLGPVFGALNVTILVNNLGGQPAPVRPMFRRFDAYESAEVDTII